ncbi:PREDICTED: growth arrest and DNA damage-inducible protein GADD45 beta-like isoform X2 [Priapulus caudatus]|nr:PREDICTED: growth arrest and DNA damage-inducible protein GADD45 beta-like isoform X2 [Priapulus caudatus]
MFCISCGSRKSKACACHVHNTSTTQVAHTNSDIGAILEDVLVHAKQQGRVTCGIYPAAKVLELEPNSVMLVILPRSRFSDVSLHIHYTLIEAFCWESNLRLLMVDSAEKLSKMLEDVPEVLLSPVGEVDKHTCATEEQDYNCVLVQYPCGWNNSSHSEDKLIEYCKNIYDLYHQPIIELPG